MQFAIGFNIQVRAVRALPVFVVGACEESCAILVRMSLDKASVLITYKSTSTNHHIVVDVVA